MGGNGDVGDVEKSLYDAGVHTMSILFRVCHVSQITFSFWLLRFSRKWFCVAFHSAVCFLIRFSITHCCSRLALRMLET